MQYIRPSSLTSIEKQKWWNGGMKEI